MDIKVEPGTYVVAVSGGVDSMALLDILARQPGLKLTVAHFDHGIRKDSHQDRRLVQKTAAAYNLPFVYDEGKLGEDASEDAARKARYEFLRRVKQATGARGIITAHHQDDLLETAIINLIRGTRRRGITAMQSQDGIIRPALHLPKTELLAYARHRGLKWHEDPTNFNTRYLRNFVRFRILPSFDKQQRNKLLMLIHGTRVINRQIDALLVNQLHAQPQINVLDRYWFTMLPHAVAREALALWLRHNGIRNYDRRLIERLVIGGKTLMYPSYMDVNKNYIISVGKEKLALKARDR